MLGKCDSIEYQVMVHSMVIVHSMVQMFADDTKVFCWMEKDSDSCDLQKDLNNMQLGGKSIYKMIDGMNDVPLSETMIEKDLHVKVDNKLTFGKHI